MNHLFETDWAPICWLKQKCTYFSQNKIRWNKKNDIFTLSGFSCKKKLLQAISLQKVVQSIALINSCLAPTEQGYQRPKQMFIKQIEKIVTPVWRVSRLHWAVLGQSGRSEWPRSRELNWPIYWTKIGLSRMELDGAKDLKWVADSAHEL